MLPAPASTIQSRSSSRRTPFVRHARRPTEEEVRPAALRTAKTLSAAIPTSLCAVDQEILISPWLVRPATCKAPQSREFLALSTNSRMAPGRTSYLRTHRYPSKSKEGVTIRTPRYEVLSRFPAATPLLAFRFTTARHSVQALRARAQLPSLDFFRCLSTVLIARAMSPPPFSMFRRAR